MKPVLSLQNVSKAFAGKYAVKDVSFDIGNGEIVGFLGPNGAGKTTSLRMALGLIKRGLYKKQTAREAVAHMAQLNGMKRGEAFKRADDMLIRYGLGDARRKKNKDMSKGMAQKVQLLAAIAHNPEFYILDEPFSGLDPVNQQVLEGIVREIAAQGHTILFSTHVMEHAERLCDRIILMSKGEKCFDGSTEDALAQAPRRLVIGSKDAGLLEMVTPFVKTVESQENDVLSVVMKDAVDTQDILVKAVDQGLKLSRFEPQRASLHEAFVALVGEDAAAENLGDNSQAEETQS